MVKLQIGLYLDQNVVSFTRNVYLLAQMTVNIS